MVITAKLGKYAWKRGKLDRCFMEQIHGLYHFAQVGP